MDSASGEHKIYYISTFLPKGIRNEILANLKIFDNNSGDVLSYSIFKGLSSLKLNNFRCINIAPVGPYPTVNIKRHFKRYSEFNDNVEIVSIPFSTILIYQHYSIYLNLYSYLKKELNPNEENRIILYSLLEPALHAVSRLKKESYKIKLVTIIPDFWDDVLSRQSLRNSLKKLLVGNVSKYYSICDGFVLLTEQMNEKIPVVRPYTVVEGMYDTNERRPSPSKKESGIKTIFYSGMIHEKFGIKSLVEAFSAIESPNLRLRICGSGDYENQLKELEKTDSRITYLGLLSREDVINEQYNAHLLVNPRTSQGEFTKYSFPSKTIEYLVSGTPTIIHRLPGIPEEYFKHCFVFKSDKKQDIITGLIEALSISEEEAYRMGRDSQDFIIKEKNAKAQCKKIIDLVNHI